MNEDFGNDAVTARVASLFDFQGAHFHRLFGATFAGENLNVERGKPDLFFSPVALPISARCRSRTKQPAGHRRRVSFEKSGLRACFKNISGRLAAGRGGWLRCASVADFSRICALVAPRHPPHTNPEMVRCRKTALTPARPQRQAAPRENIELNFLRLVWFGMQEVRPHLNPLPRGEDFPSACTRVGARNLTSSESRRACESGGGPPHSKTLREV